MCSMSLTLDVRLRSKLVTTRFSISSGERPLYTHNTLTTGMSMYGKMSTAMVAMADPPRMAIRIAITTNVYGRLRASLTIHILGPDGSDYLFDGLYPCHTHSSDSG